LTHLPILFRFGTLILASGPAPEEVRKAARQVLERGGYQTEIPQEVLPPDWLRDLLEWLASLFTSAGGSDVIVLLTWIVTAVVVAFLVVWLVSEWKHRRKRTAKESGEFEEAPVFDLGSLPDPQALATAGEYAAAVHALLLHAQWALVTRLQFDLQAALTSREVLSRVKSQVKAEEELRGLVLAVEVSRFGGAAVNRHDFDRLSDRYTRFVTAVDEALR